MQQYRLEKSRIIRGFNRAAAAYNDAALLPREVGQRLLERLDYLLLQPELIIDVGAGTGVATAQLSQRYTRANVVAIDNAAAMLDQIENSKNIRALHTDASNTPLPDGSADLLFSNLMLPWCDELDPMLVEFRRLISPRGAVSFSTFGPDTLVELRRAWRQVDQHEHVHAFFDMHDIGDALVRAGFAEPVMDVERITLTYNSVADLLRDLQRMGSINALPGRPRGLAGRQMLERLEAAYQEYRENDRLPATFEVIYAQAWGPLMTDGLMRDGLARIPADGIPVRKR